MPAQVSSDVFVLVPGIMGSVLRSSKRVLWGPSMAPMLRAIMTGTRSVAKDLKLESSPSGDPIYASALMPDVHLLPGLWKVDGYSRIRNFLLNTMGLEPGVSYFEFPYDWRLDNRVHGRRLKELTDEWLERRRSSTGNSDSRLVLIAHSMGGLVCRWLLERENGWRDTRALISYGTPYRGAPKALGMLANGLRMGFARLPELSHTIAGFPSIYQLLPIYKCIDREDGASLRLEEVKELPGIANMDPVREGIAFHREIEAAVTANWRNAAFLDKPYEIFPIVGIAQQTQQSATIGSDRINMMLTHRKHDLGGDGTVPRVSATPIERSHEHKEMYNGTKHAALQNGAAVLTHVEGILRVLAQDLGEVRAVTSAPPLATLLTLEIDDVCSANEPFAVRVHPGRPTTCPFTVTLCDAASDAILNEQELRASTDGWYSTFLVVTVPGSYRVTITNDEFPPAEDVFCVAEIDQ